jgi:drug/metabolite transporter (DMT)-like permease
MRPSPRDYFLLHFIVLLWGFTAILGLLISIPAVELVFYRTLLAAIALLVLLLWRKRNFNVGSREAIKMLATGIIMAAHWILFFESARVSTASVCLAGMATTSLWTSLIEPALTGRKVKAFEVALGLMVIVGLYIIFRFEFNHAYGLFLALCSALLAALFSVINSKLTKRHHAYMINFYEMTGAFLSVLIFLPFYKLVILGGGNLNLSPEPMDWLWIGILSIVCTVFAYSVSIELMKRISAFFLNLTVNLEPVYGIILAVLIFGDKEKMTPGFYWGTLIILISVLSYPMFMKLFRRKSMVEGAREI